MEKKYWEDKEYAYFSGVCSKVATRKSQNFRTVGINALSSGECGERKVGPKEIISNPGIMALDVKTW